jgi:hypothetical protein
MHTFFVWVETSAFSVWVREEPIIWAFPSVLTAHTIGMGLVAGINVLLALRILGVAPGVPISEMRRFFPVMWFGFWLNAISGVALLIAYPTKALTNPLFYFKLGFIALAVLLVRVIQKNLFRYPVIEISPQANEFLIPQPTITSKIRFLAMASIGCWAAAIAAGRFLAYTYVKLMSSD